MGIMNVEVDGRSTGLAGIGNLGGPVRLGNDAFEMGAPQATVPAAADGLSSVGEFGEKRQHMSDHKKLACPAGRLEHAVGFSGIKRDGLFHEDMFAGPECGN